MSTGQYIRFLALCALCLTLWPARGAAQEPQPAISWQVQAGFNGSYRAGAWFPLVVTIGNRGPDVEGTLSLRFRSGEAGTFSQPIGLPLNANKRIVLPILGDISQDGQVRADLVLRDGSTVVRRERLDLNALPPRRLVVGVISDDPAALPELSNLQRPDEEGFGNALLRVTAAALPERAELLQSFDVLFVHATDTSTWSAAQREALGTWVGSGGQLVLGGDERVLASLGELPPARVDGRASATLSGLRELGWSVRGNASDLSLLSLIVEPDAEVLARTEAGQPLLVQRAFGQGSVTVAAFGLEQLQQAGDAVALWKRVLPLATPIAPVVHDLRDQGFFTLQQALDLPALRLPSIFGLLGFLLLYIAVVGPLNYLVLRRFDRREWAYLTIPLLVVLFSGGAYVWGTLGRGSSAVLSELSIVRVPTASTSGQALSYLALFSPGRRSYDLSFTPEALVSDLEPAWQRQGRSLNVIYAEDSTRVPELLVDVGAVRTLAVEQPVAAPVLETTLRDNGAGPQLVLRNRSEDAIEDVLLVRGDGRAQIIGSLAAGEELSVDVDPDRFFPDALPDQRDGVISRQAVYGQLSGVLVQDAFAFGVPPGADDVPERPLVAPVPEPGFQAGDPNAVNQYSILGWQPRAQTTLALDGQPITGAGETLYVWTARKEP